MFMKNYYNIMLLFYIRYIVVAVCDKVLSQKYISIL